jgi:hypothetical protein
VVRFVEEVFNFKTKYDGSAPASFLPPNTVEGNDPVLVLTPRNFDISNVR